MIPFKKQCFYIFIFLFIFSACGYEKKVSTPLGHIKNEEVKIFLSKILEAAGGLDNWRAVEEIKFKKYFVLFDSTGTKEMGVHQEHNHSYFPNQKIKINWQKENQNHQLYYGVSNQQNKDKKISKTINGKLDTVANPASLNNTIRAATFVMCIPFNMIDLGAEFKYLGTETLEDGKKVEVLQAIYDPEKFKNHSTQDVWWLYFDSQSLMLEGYMVKHADHYSYVRNITNIEVEGFTFPLIRKSWRVDQNRNKLYLRADYKYSDYQVKK